MYSPPLHITLRKDSTSRKTALIIHVANWMIEKAAVGGRVFFWYFRLGTRCSQKVVFKEKNSSHKSLEIRYRQIGKNRKKLK